MHTILYYFIYTSRLTSFFTQKVRVHEKKKKSEMVFFCVVLEKHTLKDTWCLALR